ncbi:MAG: MFS transporter [Erysipelotrichaceae bacterium]|nr:MFS transporter [Erysipelotrichaceae bacterium]
MTTKETVQERVKLPEKLGFMAFSTSSNIVFNFKNLYYLTFLKMILRIPVFWASTILTIGTIWDAVNDPLIGFWSVNHKFKSGEKIRPLALYFAIPWAITIVLMFADFGLSQNMTIILCILIYLVFEAFYTFLAIPYNSMGALATNIDEDRRSINSFRSLGGCLGSGIGAVAVPILVKKVFGGLKSDIYTSEDARALLLTACVMAAICVFGCVTHYLTSKERVHQQEDNEDKIGFMDTFRMLFSIKTWIFNMLFILCYGINTAIVMAEVNDYAAYILGDSTMATPILAFYLVVSILTAIFIGSIDRKVGHKNMMIIAGLSQVIGRIPFIIFPKSLVCVCILAAATGFGSTIAFIMFNTNRNNIADIVEFKFKRRIDSMVSTCDNLITKLAEAVAVWIMGIALAMSGYNADLGVAQSLSTQKTIIALLGWVPGIICLLMAFFATRSDVMAEYKKEQAKALEQ